MQLATGCANNQMEEQAITSTHDIKTVKADQQLPGLERSCTERSCGRDWVQAAPWQPGIYRIEAFFAGEAYAPHRHDTYSIGYTIGGVQSFDYRGEQSASLSGQVMVLHPDEIHTGQAGSETGFHYRMLYIEPALIRDALGPAASSLPFVKEAVLTDPRLWRAVHAAYTDMGSILEPTALDEIALFLADGLLAHDRSVKRASGNIIDDRAVRLARDFLDANSDRTVTSGELEAVTGQDRFTLARQFRKALGTSPYRYLVMRRLDRARAAIEKGTLLTEAALMAGFSDQAHMTRQFTTTFGLSPGRWRKLAFSGETKCR